MAGKYVLAEHNWRKINDDRFKAHVICPECEAMFSLRHHTIAPNGEVSPSLVCPTDGCEFHEFVTLENWK